MGLVLRRMMNETQTVQFSTDQMITFKDSLIDWYSTAQGAGVLQTIQAMQASSQPGAKQIPYQGLPWFGVLTSLYAIAVPAIFLSFVASIVTSFIGNAFVFGVTVFVFGFFLIFYPMFRTRGLHQLSGGGARLISGPMAGGTIMGTIAFSLKFFGVTWSDLSAGSTKTTIPADQRTDPSGAQQIGEITIP
jgi:hypothetical protein